MPKSPALITKTIVDILDGLRMTEITVCDTKKLSLIFDKVIIATCNNSRQANAAIRDMKKAGLPISGIEGELAQEWILADCERVIVHMMLPHIRRYYNLEELWQGEVADKANSTMHTAH